MHAHDLLQLSVVIAWHGPVLIASPSQLPQRAIEEYWTASKCRLDRWGHELRVIRDNFASQFGFDAPSWRAISALCDEILTGEIVTRLWTAVITLHDQRHGSEDAAPIVRSVLHGHQEARHRVLNLILNYHGVGPHEAVVLNRLRHRCERWTDILLARLGNSAKLCDLAHDGERVDDFQGEWPLGPQSHVATQRAAWLLSSFAGAFVKHPLTTANFDLNQRIAQSIVASFPSDTFNDLGLLQTGWEQSLRNEFRDQPLAKNNWQTSTQDAHGSKTNSQSPLPWWDELFSAQQHPQGSWPGGNRWESLN
jgi:hypothetical protein